MNPNFTLVGKPKAPPSAVSTAVQSFAQDAPRTMQASPETAGSVAGLQFSGGEQFQLSMMLESAAWAKDIENRWEVANDDQRREFWTSLSDEDRATVQQFSDIEVPQSTMERLKSITPKELVKTGFTAAMRMLAWLPEELKQTYRTVEGGEDDTGRFFGAFSDWSHYWKRANTNEGRYYGSRIEDIADRSGWSETEKQFYVDMGLKFGRNYMLREDPAGISNAVNATLLEHVTEYGMSPEDALQLHSVILNRLDDPEQFDALNELVGSRMSLGRGVARDLFSLDPLEQPRLFSNVSGVFDMLPELVDVSLIGGKLIKFHRMATRGVGAHGDVAYRLVGERNADRVLALADESFEGNVTEAVIDLARSDEAWRTFDGSSRRMVDTIQQALNEDMLAVTRARTAGDLLPEPSALAARTARDRVATRLVNANPDSVLGGILVARGARVAERGLGTAHLAKLNPMLSDVATTLRQSIRKVDEAEGVVRIGAVQRADGLVDDLLTPIEREDVVRALLDKKFAENIMKGTFAGHQRHLPVMPGIGVLSSKTEGFKLLMREGIDWMNDSNMRFVSRLVRAGRFGDYSIAADGTEVLTDEAITALKQAGTTVRFGQVARGLPGLSGEAGRAMKGTARIQAAGVAFTQNTGKILTMFTRMNPGRVIDLAADTSIHQVGQLASLLPPSVADEIVQAYAATSNLGQRVMIFRGLVSEVFNRLGIYDSPIGRQLADEYLGKQMIQDLASNGIDPGSRLVTGQIYSASGLDRMADGASAGLYGYQSSMKLSIPEFSKLHALSRRGAFWSRVLGVDLLNSETADKVISGFWAPSVLARPGFPLRAGGEEALQFALREGGLRYLRGVVGQRALRATELFAKGATREGRKMRSLPVAVSAGGREIVERRGNQSMMWIAEQLDKLPGDRALADHIQRNLSNSNYLLGSAWVGRSYDLVSRFGSRFGNAREELLRFLAGRDVYDAAHELVERNPEFRALLQGDISGQTMSGARFAQRQIGGSDDLPAGMRRTKMDEKLEAFNIFANDTGRAQLLAQDSPEFFINYRAQMMAPFTSDRPVDQAAMRLLDEVLDELAPDGVFVGDGHIASIIDLFRARFRQLMEVDEVVKADFDRLWRTKAQMPDGRLIVDSGDRFSSVFKDPEVIGWHGTRNAIPLDNAKLELAEGGEDALEAVQVVRDLQAQVRLEDDLVKEWSGLTVPNADEAEKIAVGEQLRSDLLDPTRSTTLKLNRLRWMDLDFDKTGADFYDEVHAKVEAARRRMQQHTDELATVKDELLRNYDVDLDQVGAGLSQAEKTQLTELRRILGDVEARLHGDVAQTGMTLEEVTAASDGLQSIRIDLVERIRMLEYRQALNASASGPAGTNNLRALALQNRRDIDPSVGTGGQWYGRGTYLAADEIDDAATYARGFAEEASEASRVYGFGFDGEWNPIDMDVPMSKDVFDTVREFVTDLVVSMDQQVLNTFDELARLLPFVDVHRLPAGYREIVEDALGFADLAPPWGSWVDYQRQLQGSGDDLWTMTDFIDALDQTMVKFNVYRGLSGQFPTVKQSPLWDETTQSLVDRLSARGFTGFEHVDATVTGPNWMGTRVRVVWDSERLRGIHELDPAALRDRTKNIASVNEAVDDWTERITSETLRRITLQREGEMTQLVHPDIVKELRAGRAPTLDQLQEWNFADDGSVRRLDYDRFQDRMQRFRQAIEDEATERRVDSMEGFDDVGDALGPSDTDALYVRQLEELQDLRELIGIEEVVDASSDVRVRLRTMFDENEVEEVLARADELMDGGRSFIEDLFVEPPRQRLAAETIAPLTELERKAWFQRIWNKPFAVMSRAIDTISRDPMYLLNYARGLEYADEFFWTARPGQHQLWRVVKKMDSSDRADEILSLSGRRATRTLTVSSDESIASLASVNPKTGVVRINRTALQADYDEGLAYLRGTADSVGSEQKLEVFSRLDIDVDELKAWMDDHGGVDAYERMILAHEQAHVDLGHRGFHSGEWLSESSLHQEVEAQFAAMHKIGAGHLTAKPYGENVTIKSLLGVLEDTRAGYRRLNKHVAPDAKLGSDELTDLLRDHPLWPQLEELMEEARRIGYIQADDENTFKFLERVLGRVDETLEERHVMAAAWSFNQTRPHVDSVAISSYGTSLLRNAVPFQWAAERFIKRSVSTMFHSPESLKKLHLMYLGMHNVGIIETDDRGEDYFVYPAAQLMYDGVAQVLGTVFGWGLRTPRLVDENGDELPDDLGLSELVQIRGRTIQALPGLDDLGRPMLGPFAAFPLRGIANRFPSTAGAIEALIGPIAANENRPSWSLLVPTVVYNLVKMGDPYESYAHTSLQAFQTLAANGLLPDDSDPGSWEVFNDRLEQQMQIIAGLRVVYGFAGVAPAQIEFSGSELQQELVKLIEIYGFEDGFLRWQEQHPDSTAWQVFGTTTEGGATLPATKESFEFLEANHELADAYKKATPYLVPKPSDPGQASEFFNRAWSQQFGMELRRYRTMDEMYEAVRYAEVAPAYFRERDDYRALRESVKGTPQAAVLDQQWGQRQRQWQQLHPTFWNALTSNSREQHRREIVAELRAVRDNGIAPQNSSSAATFTLLDGYDQFEAQMNALRGVRTQEARDARDYYRNAFARWAYQVVLQQPQAESFYYRVIVPELSLDDDTLDQIEANTPALTTGA
jgi:hypothetical protein